MAKDFKIQTRFTGIDSLSRTVKTIAKNFGTVTRAAIGTNRAIKAVANSAKRMGQNLRSASLSGAIGLTAVLAPIVAFSDQINELEAVSMATTQQMSAMTSQAKQLGSTTRFSASQAASAQTFLARAGFKTNEILAATPDILNLASASNTELARTADIASNIMAGFGLEAGSMGRVVDVLAATTSGANVDLEQLFESMKLIGPIATDLKVPLEEAAAVIGFLGNIGVQGTLSGNAYKNMLVGLAAPGAKAQKILRGIGVETKNLVTGQRKTIPDLLNGIAVGLNNIPESAKLGAIKEIFGLRALSSASEILKQMTTENLPRFAESLTNVENRAQSMAETMNKGPGGAISELKSAAEGLAISIGDSGLTGQFTNIVQSLTQFTSELSKSETGTLANIAVMLTLLAVLAPIFLAIGAIVGVIAPLVSGLIFLGGVLGGFIIPLIKKLILDFIILALVNPFTAIVLAVVAVIAIFTALIVFWDDIVAAFSTGIEKIIEFFQPLIDIISTIGDIGALFGKTVLGIESEENLTETGERESVPAQIAANQVSAQANARATVEFVGTPGNGTIFSRGSGEEFDPELGLTAAAGL